MEIDRSNLNTVFSLSTLFAATIEGKLDIVKLLIRNGADVNVIDKGGISPFLMASRQQFREITDILLKHGADINSQGQNIDCNWNALHWAARNNDICWTKYLLEHGPDPFIRDKYGHTPLDRAKLQPTWPNGVLIHMPNRTKIISLIESYETLYQLKEWRPWNHHCYPKTIRNCITTIASIGKSSL